MVKSKVLNLINRNPVRKSMFYMPQLLINRLPIQDTLKKHIRPVDIITQTIINPSAVSSTETIEKNVTKTETFEMNIKTNSTFSLDLFATLVIAANGKVDIPDAATKAEFAFNTNNGFSKTSGKTASITKTVEYKVGRKIVASPETMIKVHRTIKWFENLKMPFTAKLKVNAFVPHFDNNGIMPPKDIRALLQNNISRFDFKEISHDDSSVTFEIEGEMKASFGVKFTKIFR